MKPVMQTKLYRPDACGEDVGNCFQACIASLLELPLDSVPHFTAIQGPRQAKHAPVFYDAARRWLRDDHGLDLAQFDADEAATPAEVWNDPGNLADFQQFAIGGGKSPRGDFDHAVIVALDGTLAHDPHPSGDGLDGPLAYFDVLTVMDEAYPLDAWTD